MGPTKAPGLDGFPAIFFQKDWHIMGKEVLEYCLGVLNEGREADSANTTNIVLIPKVHKPTSLVNFRPINLCTVLYKIVAKTIANRIQEAMAICIDQAQSAFVSGRLISDNILLAYEILHTFRQKRTGKKGYMAVKLDMMIINGSRGRTFKPSRGLRQATEKGARVLKDILQVYESCSGQCVNFGKSTVFYSTNTNEESKVAVLRLLRVRSSSSLEKYLCLPNMVGKRKREAFQNLADRIASRIESWSSRLLSLGGKEIFIKAILQAIPTFSMSCFLFPNVLCERIESILAQF
ncbi:reverse transcriptase [Gossypium australe]|uniref:Reverse transcriptase n=1 Tax=Gossypium australe TaxID=47621 RepID=A0A5B6VZ08_9ROSI|nr:reverse transcriptase [Gossypium australe]